MKNPKIAIVILLAVTLLAWLGIDYVFLPAYTPQSFGFWMLLAFGLAWLVGLGGGLFGVKKSPLFGLATFGVVGALAIVISIGSWTLWPGNDARLYAQMDMAERPGADFTKDFPGSGLPDAAGRTLKLPVIDKELSVTIAQSKLGGYGAQSQMDAEIFTAISVKRGNGHALVRVSPLDYSGFFVALSGKGTAGYIEVDQLTEESRLVEVPGGLKYTPGAVFGRDLSRRLRFAYRGALFGPYSFEIDDDGKPYWIAPVITHTISLFGGAELKGLVLVDPVTGAMTYHERGSEPAWVDRAVPTYLAMEQANNRLGLKNGWANRAFGDKRDVFQISDGYNYVFYDDESRGSTWFVSGVTSPNEADQTLVGFLMIDMKTKEARRYALGGITEMRAMEIAQNDERVRAQALTPTWPILTQVDGEPAYFLFLKNSVQRQRFVYVDLATGQRVAMGETVDAAAAQFALMSGGKRPAAVGLLRAAGSILRVREDVQAGVMRFILADDLEHVYQAETKLSNAVRFLERGDRVELGYRASPSDPAERFVSELRNLNLETGAGR